MIYLLIRVQTDVLRGKSGFYICVWCWGDVVELSCDVDEKRIGGEAGVELLKYWTFRGEKSEANTTAFPVTHG